MIMYLCLCINAVYIAKYLSNIHEASCNEINSMRYMTLRTGTGMEDYLWDVMTVTAHIFPFISNYSEVDHVTEASCR